MGRPTLSTDNFLLLPIAVIHEQLVFLLRRGAVWFWIHVAAAIVLCTWLWLNSTKSPILVSIWGVAIVMMAAARWLMGCRFQPDEPCPHPRLQAYAHNQLLASSLLHALWGVSGFLLFMDTIPTLALHITLLLLLALAAMPLLMLSWVALCIQVLALLTPIGIMLLFQPDLALRLWGGIVLAAAGVAILAASVLAQLLREFQEAYVRMLEQANTDPVTNLSNRRYFEQMFKLEWRRSTRALEPLSLLRVDIDHFKRFSGVRGQQAGDQCLLDIAQCLSQSARRAGDVVARYQNDGFVLLLPNTVLDTAVQLAEKLRVEIEKLHIDHVDGAIPRIVTVCVGVSSCLPMTMRENGNEDIGEGDVIYPALLLNAADRALHRAKRKGFNQIAWEYAGGA